MSGGLTLSLVELLHAPARDRTAVLFGDDAEGLRVRVMVGSPSGAYSSIFIPRRCSPLEGTPKASTAAAADHAQPRHVRRTPRPRRRAETRARPKRRRRRGSLIAPRNRARRSPRTSFRSFRRPRRRGAGRGDGSQHGFHQGSPPARRSPVQASPSSRRLLHRRATQRRISPPRTWCSGTRQSSLQTQALGGADQTGNTGGRADGHARLVMMGLAIWHFTIWVPDRFWAGSSARSWGRSWDRSWWA